MSIDDRHRDKNGEISKKHGNTLVRTLRKLYGTTFAAGWPETAKLADVLVSLATGASVGLFVFFFRARGLGMTLINGMVLIYLAAAIV